MGPAALPAAAPGRKRRDDGKGRLFRRERRSGDGGACPPTCAAAEVPVSRGIGYVSESRCRCNRRPCHTLHQPRCHPETQTENATPDPGRVLSTRRYRRPLLHFASHRGLGVEVVLPAPPYGDHVCSLRQLAMCGLWSMLMLILRGAGYVCLIMWFYLYA